MSSGIVICRLCAESKHISKQVDLEYDMIKRDEVIQHLTKLNSIIDFNDSKLPNTVCLDCICTLNKSCDFVVSVESAQKVLHDLFYKRTAIQIDLSDDIIFFERAGLDECDFLSESESDFSNESQDAATPNTDDDLISLADLAIYNPDSSVGSDEPLAVISRNPKSRTQEAHSDDFSAEDFGVSNPDSSVRFDEPVEVITPNPEANCDGIIQLGDLEPNNSVPNVVPDVPVVEADAIIPLESLASNKSDNNQLKIISPSIGSVEPIAHSNDIIHEDLEINKTKNNVDTDEHNKVIAPDNDTHSIPSKALKSNNLVPVVVLDKLKKTSKKKTPDKESFSLDPNSPAKIIKAWKNYKWLCTFCEKIFPSINELRSHSMAVHSVCNPYRCTKCQQRKQSLNPFLEHVSTHIKHLKLSCLKCPAKFDKKREAKKHSKVHFKKLSCPGCSTSFKNSNELKRHQAVYLNMKYRRTKKNPLIGEDGLTCTICSKTYEKKSGLRKHLTLHKGRKRDYVCEICGKEYFELNHLTYHMGTHSDDRPYKCKICNLSFQRQNVLKEHVWTHNDKPFPCDKCDKTFKLKKLLKLHIAVHDDILPFECGECQKRFRIKGTLIRHLRVHTGIKPFMCQLCKQIYRNRSNLNSHMQAIHGLNNSKPKIPQPVINKDTKAWKKEMMRRKHAEHLKNRSK